MILSWSKDFWNFSKFWNKINSSDEIVFLAAVKNLDKIRSKIIGNKHEFNSCLPVSCDFIESINFDRLKWIRYSYLKPKLSVLYSWFVVSFLRIWRQNKSNSVYTLISVRTLKHSERKFTQSISFRFSNYFPFDFLHYSSLVV